MYTLPNDDYEALVLAISLIQTAPTLSDSIRVFTTIRDILAGSTDNEFKEFITRADVNRKKLKTRLATIKALE
tara:strand:+ start:2376 stop:2594 length:219 start_codon:yes stop_codon:yes gene_type:complete